jgi:hypothetical protein
MITLTFWASSCCMLLTCLSTLSASSSAITLQPSTLPSATTAPCHALSVSFAAIGFWKPIVQLVPAFFAGVL